MAHEKGESKGPLKRDPFEGMELPPEPPQEEPTPPLSEARPPEAGGQDGEAEGTAGLKGKGIWILYSQEVDLAIEMAAAIGATHILYKTGHRGMFFVEAAARVHDRVRQAGLIPFAWPFIHCDDPNAEAEVAIKSMQVGYEGIVFDIEDQASGRTVGAAALGRRLMAAGLDPQRLFYSSYPNIWQHLDIPYREMNQFCHGGFMPQCYPTFQRTARTVIGKWGYGEHARWSEEWGDMPPLYPILAAYKDEHATQRLSAQEFLEWAETLASHAPPFYSIYRAESTNRDLWSILAALGEPAPRPVAEPSVPVSPPPPVEARPVSPAVDEPVPSAEAAPAPAAGAPPSQPELEEAPIPTAVYHVATVNDTVWGICQRHGIPRAKFWAWNGHLWDQEGLPRDTLYLREGWRLRVG